MSAKGEPNLGFNMTIDELINLCYEKETYFARDTAELAERGITIARINGLITLRGNLQNIPTDITMRALITKEVEAKDEKRAILETNMREIVNIARIGFKNNPSDFKTFGNVAFSTASIAELCIRSIIVASRATAYLTELTPLGLTSAMIASLATQKTDVEEGIVHVNTAESNRIITTNKRDVAAKTLYTELSKMCQTAQAYYAERKPLKADDYIIYDLPNNMQQRTGEVKVGAIVYREINSLNEKCMFRLQVRNGKSLVFYFSNKAGGAVTSKQIEVKTNVGSYAEYAIEELGYDKASGNVFFNIQNPSTTDIATYRIQIVG
jgi:hypothetical protein